MKIAIGNDHRGIKTKNNIIKFLTEDKNLSIIDVGTFADKPVDYSDHAKLVCNLVRSGSDFGILICGTGIGMCISANKMHGIRAALVQDSSCAKLARYHNNANVLCLSEDCKYDLKDIVTSFISTKQLEEDRHERRVRKMMELEYENEAWKMIEKRHAYLMYLKSSNAIIEKETQELEILHRLYGEYVNLISPKEKNGHL